MSHPNHPPTSQGQSEGYDDPSSTPSPNIETSTQGQSGRDGHSAPASGTVPTRKEPERRETTSQGQSEGYDDPNK